jgi:hypothetical protein
LLDLLRQFHPRTPLLDPQQYFTPCFVAFAEGGFKGKGQVVPVCFEMLASRFKFFNVK